MNELIKYDSSFNEAMFITKSNNIFIMLYTSIMMDDLDRVRHFISAELEEKYEAVLRELNSKNLRQMYDELNVKTNTITGIKIENNEAIINTTLVSRYMDYKIDKDSGEKVSGDDTKRIEKTNYLVFKKTLGNNYNGIDRKCPGCGANISVNTNGKCEYCGSIFNVENYDWILTSLD